MTLQPPGESLRGELEKLQDRIKQLEEQRAREKLDERFATIQKGVDGNAKTIGNLSTTVENLAGQQRQVLSLLESQRGMIADMRSKLDDVSQLGVTLVPVDQGAAGRPIWKPIGKQGDPSSTFRLERDLIGN